jgi:hypothetical protein
MKFRRNVTRKKGDSCVADAETGETNGPFISQHELNESHTKSSVNMGYELKDRRSILGNGRVFICCCSVRPYSRDQPNVVQAVNLCKNYTLIEAGKPGSVVGIATG